MMARANSSMLPCAARAAIGAICGIIRSSGSCTPITPVELCCTAIDAMSQARATASAISTAFAMPRSPVAALAQPELTRMALQWPRLSRRWRRSNCTGAAQTWLVVYMAASVAPAGQRIMPMSMRPGFLIAALAALDVKPSGSSGAAPAGPCTSSLAIVGATLVITAIQFRWGQYRGSTQSHRIVRASGTRSNL